MGATPRSSVLDPESPPPSLFAGASAAPSAISPPHAGFGVWGEGLPGRACVLPLGPGKCACPGALSDAIVRASAQRGRSLCVNASGAGPERRRSGGGVCERAVSGSASAEPSAANSETFDDPILLPAPAKWPPADRSRATEVFCFPSWCY